MLTTLMPMRLPAVFVAAGLGLAGCNASNVSAQIAGIVTAAQAEAAKICQFVPDAAAVISIVNSAAGDTGLQIGDAICTALGSPPKAGAKRKFGLLVTPLNIGNGTVNGVQITGAPVR